jgi:transcriptional regulator GlxA family with amidase domain
MAKMEAATLVSEPEPQACRGEVARVLQHGSRDDRVRKTLEILEASPSHRVSDLAELMQVSASRLSRIFKMETGISLGAFIAVLRMRRAASLLARTTEPIKAIASVAGYNHSSSFTRAFSLHFFESPRQYRRRSRLVGDVHDEI